MTQPSCLRIPPYQMNCINIQLFFRFLRPRLRGLPSLANAATLPDSLLLALLTKLTAGAAVDTWEGLSRVRLMDWHPEHGDGCPRTEAEKKIKGFSKPGRITTNFDPWTF